MGRSKSRILTKTVAKISKTHFMTKFRMKNPASTAVVLRRKSGPKKLTKKPLQVSKSKNLTVSGPMLWKRQSLQSLMRWSEMTK